MVDKVLLHFTGRAKSDDKAYGILKAIIGSSELLLSWCPTLADELFEANFMMACLTDPEKVDIEKHESLFGKFAVAFKREAIVKYGANPVIYVTKENYQHIQSQLGLYRKFEDLNKDRDWRSESEPYQFTDDEFKSFYFLAGLAQELEYKRKKDNYFQSEWRILYHPDKFKGHDSEDEFGLIRPSSFNGRTAGYMKFSKDDVSHILVPKKYYSQAKRDFPEIAVKKFPIPLLSMLSCK